MSADTTGRPIATAGCEPGDVVVIVPVPAPGLDAPKPVHATVTRASDAAIYAETDGGARYRRDRLGHLERASERPAAGLEATFWDRVAHDSELRRVEADGGEPTSGRVDPADDPRACSLCGVHISMLENDHCEPCAREIGAKPPMERCMHCARDGPREQMETVDVSTEDEYYPEIRYLCGSCSGGGHGA